VSFVRPEKVEHLLVLELFVHFPAAGHADDVLSLGVSKGQNSRERSRSLHLAYLVGSGKIGDYNANASPVDAVVEQCSGFCGAASAGRG
jgi:hypothetical protein